MEEKKLLFLIYKLNSISNFKISRKKIKETFLSIYNFPNIDALKDGLLRLGIQNKIVRINNEQFLSLTPLFFAYIFKKGLVLVTEKTNNKIVFYDQNKKKIKTSYDSFLMKWDGLVIVFDNKNEVVDSNFTWNEIVFYFKKYRSFVLIIILLLTTTLFFKYTLNYFLITKTIGFLISTMILITDVKKQKIKICSINSKFNCDSIFNDNVSFIYKKFKISDLSFIYFLWGLVFCFIPASNFLNYKVFGHLINITSIGIFIIPFLSIGYQFYFKKFCTLCIGMVLVLLTETILSLFLYEKTFLDFKSLFFYAITFLTSIILWSYVKCFVIIRNKYFKNKYDYLKLKHKTGVLQFLQEEEKIYNMTSIKDLITIGGLKKEQKITIVFNPYCSMCKFEFLKIKEQIKNQANFLPSISLIFFDIEKKDITLFLIEQYYLLDKIKYLELIINWFQSQDEKYFVNQDLNLTDKSKKILNSHVDFCLKNGINYTPTIIYGEKRLPKIYTIEDLL